MAQVKPEIKVEDTKHIGDVDEFEEDTDLQIPRGGNAWLLKVSEDMWKTWSEIHKNAAEGDQITLGHLRVFHEPQKNGKQKIQIRLDDALPQQKSIPKMYNLDLKSDRYNNTVIFSEKDLPGHNSNVRPSRPPPGQRPGGINKFDRYNNQQPRKPGSYRTAIPKQTALAPKVVNEADMHPVEDKTSLDHFAKTYQAALHAGKKTQIVTDARIKHPGTDRDSFKFGTLTSKVGAGNRKKPVKEKAVRMEKPALLDALKNCFREYTYWSLKALRQRLRQPEAYIKETLDDIATLMRQGDFVQTYKLKPEYRALLEEEGVVVKEESAVAKMETTDEGTGDEMDEDEEFEDVKME